MLMPRLRIRRRRSLLSSSPTPPATCCAPGVAALPRFYSTTPMSRLRLRTRCHRHQRRLFSSSASPPSRRWSPHAAFSAATECARAGTLSREDAHSLFDELLRQATPVPGRSLNGFLAALARASSSSGACGRHGPALALALFNRVSREEAGPKVAPLTVHTYGILMVCCCRVRRPDLGLGFFFRLLKTGLKMNQIVANIFLQCLCDAKQADEAVDVLLRRMSELSCVPDAFSYNIVMKSLCDNNMSQRALNPLQGAAQEGGTCSLGVVAYSTVIHSFFKEGEVGKACNLFHEMMQQGIVPNVVTYNSVIDALCKAGAMDKAELVLQQMADNGVPPDTVVRVCV